MMFDFEKLDVYQLALEVCEDVEGLLRMLPKEDARMADQLNRATLSIPLNIAEASGRFHDKERKQFFAISRGSAFECVPLLTLFEKKKRINEMEHANLREKVVRLVQMLTKLIQKFDD